MPVRHQRRKAEALNSLPDRQRARAESLLPTLKQEMNIPVAVVHEWRAEKKRSGDEIDQAQDCLAEMAERGFGASLSIPWAAMPWPDCSLMRRQWWWARRAV